MSEISGMVIITIQRELPERLKKGSIQWRNAVIEAFEQAVFPNEVQSIDYVDGEEFADES